MPKSPPLKMENEEFAETDRLLLPDKEEFPSVTRELTSTTVTAIIGSCDRVANIPSEAYADDEPLPAINRAYGLRRLSLRPAQSSKQPNPTSAYTNEELSAHLPSSETSSLVEPHTQARHQERSEPKWHREHADATSTADTTAPQKPKKPTFHSRIRSVKDHLVSRVSNLLPRFRKYKRLDTDTPPSTYLQRAKYEAGKHQREAERNSIPSPDSGPVETKMEWRRDFGAMDVIRKNHWGLPPRGSGRGDSCSPAVRESGGRRCIITENEWEKESVGRYWG